MRSCLLLPITLTGLACASFAQQTATDNDAIVRMVAAGLSEDVIIGVINSQPGLYKSGADDIIQLKNSRVPDRVIEAVVKRGSPSTEGIRASTWMPEIGLYVKNGQTWKDIKPEVVNWKTGGVLKHAASMRIVKGDINGLVYGVNSPTRLTLPADVLIYTSEGVGGSEYQLVRLHEHANGREFRTLTGGVLHVSEGAMRDTVPFESNKTAPRTYTVTLDHLTPGEYGFLPPNNQVENHAAASLGKMYTFRVEQ